MTGFIRALTELLREIQKMAGGRIRGQIVFWVVFIIFVALAANPAYTSVSDVMSKLGLPFGLPQLFISFLIALISATVLIGIGGAIGTLIGMFNAVAFGSKTRLGIDRILVDLIQILKTLNETNPDENVAKLLTDADALYGNWSKSKINKYIRFGAKPPVPRIKEPHKQDGNKNPTKV